MKYRNATLLALCIIAGCHSAMFKNAEKKSTPPRRTRFTANATPGEMADALAAADDDDISPVSVLIINGESITIEDVLEPIRQDLADRADSMSPDAYRKHLRDIVESRVRRLARDTLLFQEASRDLTEQEWEALEGFVDQRIRDQINKEFDGRRSLYEKALKDEGLNVAEGREQVRRDMTIIRWIQLKISKTIVDPTRDELAQVFEMQKPQLTQAPRRDMQLIEVSILGQLPNGVTAPDDDQLSKARAAASQKAQKLRQQIVDGADFAEIAREHSDGLRARNGGRWGWVSRDGVRERWARAVEILFNLSTSGVPSDVIETPDAFFIVQAAEIDPGRQPDFESVQPELIERFRETEFNRRVEEHIARLQEKAEIHPKNIGRFLQGVANAAPQPRS